MSPPIEALRQLRDHQKQIDESGEMVGVSRQALDEVLASFDGKPLPVGGTDGIRKALRAAIFDPGATEGYKGNRCLTDWQTDAAMRAVDPFFAPPTPTDLPAAARQLKADLMANTRIAIEEGLPGGNPRTVSLSENEAEEIVALALQRLGAPAEASPLPQVDLDELDQLVQTSDEAGRMELVLRLIRQFVMGDMIHPESGSMRDWLRDWVDGIHHGPCGGPLIWPGALPNVARQMIVWGFQRSDEGYTVLALQEAPPAGEKPN